MQPFQQDDLDKDALLRQLGVTGAVGQPWLGLGAGGANRGEASGEASFENDDPANYLRESKETDTGPRFRNPTLGLGAGGPAVENPVDLGPTPPGTSDTMPIPPVATAEVPLDAPAGTGQSVLGRTTPDVGPIASVKPPVSGAAYTGFTPKYAMEGFNFGREQNPGKSAKDAFAMLANQAPPPPLNDKAALGEWFKTYIQPGMDALGHKVSSVTGDTFSYANPEGAYTVDYGRGAGAEGGALAWQAQTPGAGQGPGGARAGTPTSLPPSDKGVDMLGPTGGTGGAGPWATGYVPYGTDPAGTTKDPSDPMAQIQAEIDALTKGGQSPMDAAALMKLLQGGQP